MSDAAFLGWSVTLLPQIHGHLMSPFSLAAKAAGIPSILITNFTFDSVYSYLSTNLIDASSPHPMHLDPNNMHLEPHPRFDGIVPDVPVPFAELSPLVDQIHEGYRCADLLLTLPGNIPIPSFSQTPALPAPNWVDSRVNKFHPEIIEHLIHPPSAFVNLPPIPFPSWSPLFNKIITRTTSSAPLLVRPPTVTPSSVYTPEGRSRVLSSVGVPIDLHDPTHTKVLLVSFGGQTIRKPSRSRSGSTLNSKAPTRVPTPEGAESHQAQIVVSPPPSAPADMQANGVFGDCLSNASPITRKSALIDMHLENLTLTKQLSEIDLLVPHLPTSPKLATPSHIWIPGAPPALKAPNTPSPTMVIPTVATFPPTPVTSPTPRRPVISSDRAYFDIVRADPANFEDGDFSHLLPDSSWIAIVCGVSKEQWNEEGDDSELPEGFYVAPKTVYMPDLTAVSNVLLGKLVSSKINCLSSRFSLCPLYPRDANDVDSCYLQGYGTVAECVDACTPFVYGTYPIVLLASLSLISKAFSSVPADVYRGTRASLTTGSRRCWYRAIARVVRGWRLGEHCGGGLCARQGSQREKAKRRATGHRHREEGARG